MESPSSPSDRAALIFDQARQLAEAAREAYLREACKGDSELRRLIDDLLAAHAKQGEFLAEPTHARPQLAAEGPAVDSDGGATTELSASALSAPESRQIGRYMLLQQIGEGGFGEVWMAEQREPIKRRVALKIIKPGMDSRQVIARFEAERQALAMMDHPNIARVLDAGVTDAGRPYFVMELVRGVPITEYADTENLDPRARIELFASVCNAVQHAHQKGIIHRDIKPPNVLVTVTDGKPVPKVIDFGIAKATGGELTDKTLFTEFRQFVGTPQYMSPEQAGMSGVDIDTRSDVYSLGVLLYELLTGATPFDAARLRSAALEEMRRIIREEDPPRPSTRVSTLGDALSVVAQHRRVEPARLGALIRGDLDWITMKCLEKDRGRRYGTASDLAADVQRHLAGEAVLAAPPSLGYRVRKFAHKHKASVLSGFAVTAALVIGVAATSWQWLEAKAANATLRMNNRETQQQLASVAAEAARLGIEAPGGKLTVPGFGSLEFTSSSGPGGDSQVDIMSTDEHGKPGQGKLPVMFLAAMAKNALRDLADSKRDLEVTNHSLNNERNELVRQRDIAELWAARGQIAAARIALDERDAPTCRARLDAVPEWLRNWEWNYLATQLDDASLVLHGHKHEVSSAMFSPDSTHILTVGSSLDDDNVVRMWDAATGKVLFAIRSDVNRVHPIAGPREIPFGLAGFAPDGKSFMTFTPPRPMFGESFPSVVQRWDAANGRELQRITLPEDRPDVPYQNRAKAAISPDGTRLLWARASGTRAALIDLQAPERVIWLDSTGHFRGYPFSPDGRLIYTVHDDTDSNDESQEVVHVWDASTGERRFQTPPTAQGKQDEEIHFAMFSADSRYLITNQWSGNSLVWDVATGTQLRSPPSLGGGTSGDGSTYQPPFASCSPDGKTVVGLLKNHRGVRAWDLSSGVERWRFENDVRIEFLAFSPDGHVLLFSDASPSTRLLDVETGRSIAVLPGESADGLGLIAPYSPFSADGQRLATKTHEGDVQVWRLPITPARTELASAVREITWSIFVPESNEIVAALDDHTLRVYDAWTEREKRRLASDVDLTYGGGDGTVGTSGRRLAIVDTHLDWTQPRVRVWDLSTGVEIASFDPGSGLREGDFQVEAGPIRFVGSRLLIPRLYNGEGTEEMPTRYDLVEWDPDSNKASNRFDAFSKCWRGTVVSPTNDRIVFAFHFGPRKGERTLVDAVSGDDVASLEPWAASGWVPPATFSPDGKNFAGIIRQPDGEETLQVWRAADGARGTAVKLDRIVGSAQAVRYSPDGSRIGIVTWGGEGAQGGYVILVDVTSGQIRWSSLNPGKSIDNLDFTPDGSRIATSRRMFEYGTDFWDAADGTKVFSVPYRLGDPVSVEQKDWHAFSADGASLFLRDRDANPIVLHSRPRRSR